MRRKMEDKEAEKDIEEKKKEDSTQDKPRINV